MSIDLNYFLIPDPADPPPPDDPISQSFTTYWDLNETQRDLLWEMVREIMEEPGYDMVVILNKDETMTVFEPPFPE